METSESLLVDSLLQFEYQKDHHFQPKFANQSLHTCRRPLERTSDHSFHLLFLNSSPRPIITRVTFFFFFPVQSESFQGKYCDD